MDGSELHDTLLAMAEEGTISWQFLAEQALQWIGSEGIPDMVDNKPDFDGLGLGTDEDEDEQFTKQHGKLKLNALSISKPKPQQKRYNPMKSATTKTMNTDDVKTALLALGTQALPPLQWGLIGGRMAMIPNTPDIRQDVRTLGLAIVVSAPVECIRVARKVLEAAALDHTDDTVDELWEIIEDYESLLVQSLANDKIKPLKDGFILAQIMV